jgi:hypothetical protein
VDAQSHFVARLRAQGASERVISKYAKVSALASLQVSDARLSR